MHSEIQRRLNAILKETRELAQYATIVVVANLKPKGDRIEPNVPKSLATEYLSENEASQLISGFQENGFYVKFYDDERQFLFAVLSGEFSALPRNKKIVYNIAQGGIGMGRKSLIPAFCRLMDIPICNSNALVVSLCRHKFHVARLLEASGLAVADTWLFDPMNGWLLGKAPPQDMELLAKPCWESASIGISDESKGRLTARFMSKITELAEQLDQPVIVQQFISGYELEVPVLEAKSGRVALDPVAITLGGSMELGDRFLDFETVYEDDYGFSVPSAISNVTKTRIKQAAIDSFTLLGISGVGRIDFRVCSTSGKFFITDVATSPHLIRHSSFAFAFSQLSFGYEDLMSVVVGVNAAKQGWI